MMAIVFQDLSGQRRYYLIKAVRIRLINIENDFSSYWLLIICILMNQFYNNKYIRFNSLFAALIEYHLILACSNQIFLSSEINHTVGNCRSRKTDIFQSRFTNLPESVTITDYVDSSLFINNINLAVGGNR
jgi:hypothetical protein